MKKLIIKNASWIMLGQQKSNFLAETDLDMQRLRRSQYLHDTSTDHFLVKLSIFYSLFILCIFFRR